MNKQEALKWIEVQKETLIRLTGWAVYVYIEELIKSLDEPQKVKVPQFIAKHIEDSKEVGRDLQDAMNSSSIHEEVDQWLYTKNNMEIFARAWLDGYEVEKEKRYEVILCNGQSLKTVYRQGGDHLDFEMVYGDLESFTRKRLEEAGFGWVFDCPGIEIEEVE